MRICLFTISPKKGGGVIRKTILLVDYLTRAGCEVDWYYPRSPGRYPPYVESFLSDGKVKVKEIFAFPGVRVLDALDPFSQVPRRCDIHQIVSGFCLDGMLFQRKGLPYFCWVASTITEEKLGVAKFHGIPKGIITRFNLKLGLVLERKYAKTAYMLFANSASTRDALLREFGLPDEKVKVAYPPVDTELYRYFPQEKRDPNNPYILFMGIFSPRKNLELLLEAFSIVSRRKKNVQLLLVGKSGRFLPEYRRKCQRLKIDRKVAFVGEVKDNVLYFQHALATVLPSKQEGFGMVLAESLACGTPVIATKCGGTREIVDHRENGYLTDPDKPGQMANYLLTLIESQPLRSRMGKRGREKVEKLFSVEAVGRQFLSEYEGFLRNRRTER